MKNTLETIPDRDTFIADLIIENCMTTNSFTRAEIEQIVVMERLHLYNRNIPCGPKAIYKKLDQEGIHPLPSLSTIKRILIRHALTHGRTGHYP